MAKINVETKTKLVKNETTKKQDEELKAAKKKIEEQNKKALAKRESNKKAAELKKEASKETSKEDSEVNTKEIVDLASKALSGKKEKGFFGGLITGALIGLVLGIFISTTFISNVGETIETSKDSVDQIVDETVFGYTAIDFKNAILGESVEKQDLIVMEQPITIETTITKAGLGNLQIFSKIKNVTFAGSGIYTVDLSKMSEDKIVVDEEEKSVTIYIPHTVLYKVAPDYESAEFEDTEKGILAFGDLALSMEDQNELEKSVESAMKERLAKQDILATADEIALTKVWGIYAPIVNKISDEYVTVIEFEK